MRMAAIATLPLIILSLAEPAFTQDVQADEIVSKLKMKPPTRSATKGGVNEADRDFLRRLPTRGISIEQRIKFQEIVAKKDLPSIDIPIQFEFDSAAITQGAHKQLEALATALKDPRLATGRYSLNGYTDARGTAQHNQALSEARAESVQAALVKEFGIAADGLVAVGFGEQMLKEPDDPEGAINRRVEVVRLGNSGQ